MPKPTGTLLETIDSYVDKQLALCLSTATERDKLSCQVTGSQWCGFSTDVPPSVECRADAHPEEGTTSASSATAPTAVPDTGAIAAGPTLTNDVLGSS
ncbi:hypothetical protein DL768_009750 [Monosporascus sp. mg162]|nr:hypothetical protein DL768_009750 [Monosporascus sp. mg162]